LEARYLDGHSIGNYFDLIAGTSTGGIIALGLGAGLTAAELRDLYVNRGREIFPPGGAGFIGRVYRRLRSWRRGIHYTYDQYNLARILVEVLGDRKFGEAAIRLCIPSFDGEYGEVYIFKTPHHPDYRKDLHESMVKVGLATSAAPTYFRPMQDGGYTFIDGGVWANNPVMIGLVEALTSFDVSRERIRILSVGCGDNPYSVTGRKVTFGGLWHWRDIFTGAMRLQSQNAIGQAGLLLGRDRLVRIDAPSQVATIGLDDWRQSVDLLPAAAAAAVAADGERVAMMFLRTPVKPYVPVVPGP
jgi:patatin-like phospholipase/acyl hydrolase